MKRHSSFCRVFNRRDEAVERSACQYLFAGGREFDADSHSCTFAEELARLASLRLEVVTPNPGVQVNLFGRGQQITRTALLALRELFLRIPPLPVVLDVQRVPRA